MKKKIRYTNEPLGEVRVVRDFLPSLALSKHSVEYFKKEARRHHTQYQKMIRRLIDYYVAQHEELPATKR